MKPARLPVLACVLALFAAPLSWSAVIENGSFENPHFPDNGDTFLYNPLPVGWTFNGYSGIATSPNPSGFNPPPAADGNQVAFLQYFYGASSQLNQTILFDASGLFRLTFADASRASDTIATPYEMYLDSDLIYSGLPTFGAGFVARSFDFLVSAGSHTLTIAPAANLSGDKTTFFDNFSLSAVPAASVPENAPAWLPIIPFLAMTLFARRSKR